MLVKLSKTAGVWLLYLMLWYSIYTALHAMQTRCSDENSVRPSVCQTQALWKNEFDRFFRPIISQWLKINL